MGRGWAEGSVAGGEVADAETAKAAEAAKEVKAAKAADKAEAGPVVVSAVLLCRAAHGRQYGLAGGDGQEAGVGMGAPVMQWRKRRERRRGGR